jgi:hypothetical protein
MSSYQQLSLNFIVLDEKDQGRIDVMKPASEIKTPFFFTTFPDEKICGK